MVILQPKVIDNNVIKKDLVNVSVKSQINNPSKNFIDG